VTEFTDTDLSGARFRHVRLNGARFHDVDLRGVVVTAAYVAGMDVSGEVESLRVNGVDVVPLVEAELDRRYPERALMRPADAAGFRTAWDALDRLWGETVQRLRALPPDLLHERPDADQWSVVEHLRHLVFATDAWVRRAYLGDPRPWHPLDLPHDEMPDEPSVPRDRAARPSLDEVLALRDDRRATVRRVLATLTDEELARSTTPVTEPGYPEPESHPVARCLGAVVNEEWEHRLYVERDLALLADRTTGGTP
jgi:uncharacterized protein YjbI with pentapeptide repeats